MALAISSAIQLYAMFDSDGGIASYNMQLEKATTNALAYRHVYTIIIVIVTLFPSSLCNKKCDSLMDDDQLFYNNEPPVMITDSYCFLNECTIIIVESNASLNIINNTGGWIIATNRTNLFTIFTNDSMQNCSSDGNENSSQRPNVVLYAFEIVVNALVLIAATANVGIHFMYKELRTVPGILIMIFCASISIVIIIALVQIIIYYNQTNMQVGICAILSFSLLLCVNIYEATKTTFLAHFAYTMYRSYRLLGNLENKRRSLLCKYITFIIVASTIFITITITVHVMSKAALAEMCFLLSAESAMEGMLLPVIINYAILIIWLLVEMSMSTIGVVLYFFNVKKCHTVSTSRDFRVAIILTVNVDISIATMVIFLFVHTTESTTHLRIVVVVFGTVIEQITLFMTFICSSKVTCCSTE